MVRPIDQNGARAVLLRLQRKAGRDQKDGALLLPLELSKHVDQIVMRPVISGDQRHCVAEGDWNLIGKYEGRPGAALRNLEMVAGSGLNRRPLSYQPEKVIGRLCF